MRQAATEWNPRYPSPEVYYGVESNKYPKKGLLRSGSLSRARAPGEPQENN